MSTFSKILAYSSTVFARKKSLEEDKMEEETGKITSQSCNSSSPPTLSTDESCINSVFGSVPTRAEADYSMTAFKSFMNREGPRMLVENPGFQPVEFAFQIMKTPMVQEMVESIMRDIGVITAILKNGAVQGFLGSLMPDDSTLRLTNGTTNTAAALALAADNSQFQGSQNEHGLVSMVLRWLLENIWNGFEGIFGTLKSLVNNTIDPPQIENIGSDSGSKQVIELTLFLSIINLLIVFVRRALKHKLMV